MNKTIDVFVYSYKGKNLVDVINQLNKTSKNKINIQLFDQNPIDRRQQFSNILNLKYKHIIWDIIKSPCLYKNNFIKKSNADYILILSDNILMSDGWDERFINFINDKIIISGSGKLSISKKDEFSIQKNISESSLFNLTNYINRDFIFGKKETFDNIRYPEYIKYNGEEEILSLDIYCSGIDIYSAPSKTYSSIKKDEHSVYIPYSVDHLYNECISLLLNEKNNFIELKNNRSISDFEQFHNFIFKENLSYLPYQNNDVLYDQYSMQFGNMGGSKFIKKVTQVN